MSSGEIDVIIHATEDINKILKSVKKVFSLDLERLKIRRTDLSGHFGNPLIYIKIKLDRFSVNTLLDNIFSKMLSHDKIIFLSNLDEYIHKKKLYLRIDKQELCKGNVSLSESDSIRIIIRNISKNKLLRQVEG